MSRHGGRSKRCQLRLAGWSVLVGILLVVGETVLGQSLALPLVTVARAAAPNPGPNRYDPPSAGTVTLHVPASRVTSTAGTLPYAAPRKISVPMKDGRVRV